MTRRTFRVVNIVEILIHWKAGRNKAEVARSLGVDRGTVTKYTAKAESEGYSPDGDQLSTQEWGALVNGSPRAGRPSAPEPHPRHGRRLSGRHRRDAQDQHRDDRAPAPT